MKKLLAILILMAILISLTGCSRVSTNGPKSKIIKIDSNPQGATVFIDNDAPVKTPVEYKLTSGTHFMTFRKEGYYDYVDKNVEVNETTNEISVTLNRIIMLEGTGPIEFDTVPVIRCCSVAVVTYSNIFYDDTVAISGKTDLESFDFVFPSGKTVHFDAQPDSSGVRKFSKVVTFDELGFCRIVSNGQTINTFDVAYKTKILSGNYLNGLFTNSSPTTIYVPNGKEVEVKILVTDAKGNIIKNTPLGVYNWKTDENGTITFKVLVKGESGVCCPNVYVDGKEAPVRIYGNILAMGYDFIRFSKDGNLIESSVAGIPSRVDISKESEDLSISDWKQITTSNSIEFVKIMDMVP